MLNIPTVAQIVAILIIAVFLAWKEIREYRKRRDFNLSGNPERCNDHELRLRSIEEKCGDIRKDIAVLSTRFDVVDRRIDNIAEVFSIAGDTKF